MNVCKCFNYFKNQNKSKYVHTRPKYNVRIDLDKLRPDPGMQITRVNSASTYFYNTIPNKKASFTIDPNFSSETLVEQQRARGESCPRFRRNNAFVY